MNENALLEMVRQALAEDVGAGDVTTELTVDADVQCRAVLTAKSDGVLSGMTVFRAVFDALDAGIGEWDAQSDGAAFTMGDVLAEFTANARATLTGERTALNFVQHLTGVASLTARFVAAVEGLDVRILDTRKTIPLFRELDKEAVLHGGGANHRRGLYDAILIKDNHIQAAGGIEEALRLAQAGKSAGMTVEIEVTSLEECDRALAMKPDIIMLDNMTLDEMREAIARRGDTVVQFEASGNVSLETVREVAETGVDIISVGALTHSAPAADISLGITQL